MTTHRSETIFIKNGRLLSGDQAYSSEVDIRIHNGVIAEVGTQVPNSPQDSIIDATGCFILPGLVDMRARSGDPGDEHKEDLNSLYASASLGGVTHVGILPDTKPLLDSKSSVEYIKERHKHSAIHFMAIGAATRSLKGEELTEMYDMHLAGAMGFSNADHSFTDGQALKRALLYAKSFGGKIMTHAVEASLGAPGTVNESASTIHTGLKTAHSMAEYLQVQKEISIAAYCEAPIHFSHISTKESLAIIRDAQERGLPVTCDVALSHLLFTDADVTDYNTSLKLVPPLRSEEDRKALIQGIVDGTVAAIVSDHNPQNVELKDIEFDYATPGASILPAFLSGYHSLLADELPLEDFVRATSAQPRSFLNLDPVAFKPGETADLCIFNPEKEWTLTKENNPSKSNNNPLIGKTLKGFCKTTLLGEVWHENPM